MRYTVATVCGSYHCFTFKQTWSCKQSLIKMYVRTEYRFVLPAGYVGRCYSLHGKTDCCCLHCCWTQAFNHRTKLKISFQAPFRVFSFIPHKDSNRAKQLQAKPVHSYCAVQQINVRENFFSRALVKGIAD